MCYAQGRQAFWDSECSEFTTFFLFHLTMVVSPTSLVWFKLSFLFLVPHLPFYLPPPSLPFLNLQTCPRLTYRTS
ncbi:uncharacterized protein BDV17DRAFT_255237 [Aspergillus undulatus]|uniref:uncharacterized protein n=1 Tax=Aspergillus undulatus TaxID=1810928 RepID=UPI003CCD8C67